MPTAAASASTPGNPFFKVIVRERAATQVLSRMRADSPGEKLRTRRRPVKHKLCQGFARGNADVGGNPKKRETTRNPVAPASSGILRQARLQAIVEMDDAFRPAGRVDDDEARDEPPRIRL